MRIDGELKEPNDHKHGPYHNGNNLSEGVSASNDNNESVYAEAYISGYDGGEQVVMTDYATYYP